MSVDKSNLLTARPVTTFQKLSTRLRFLLACPRTRLDKALGG